MAGDPRTAHGAPKEFPACPPRGSRQEPVMRFTSKSLSPDTWPVFARLVEKPNGIFGGCGGISFHLGPGEGKRTPAVWV